MVAAMDEKVTELNSAVPSSPDQDYTAREMDMSKDTLIRQVIQVPETGWGISGTGAVLNNKAFGPAMEIGSSSACLAMSLGLYGAEGVNIDGSGMKPLAGYPSSVDFSQEEKEQLKSFAWHSVSQRQRNFPPKQSQHHQVDPLETPKEVPAQMPVRVARPPGEGRGRNQLLPRYWPRITDQELQQITAGDSNCTITPLFEKMLSASDAGRIGRLVLPKACAEAYFPPISQPEGLPLKIQDISGKEWVFQFRFWPNNNSRMYVLEGVTPCIQSMQLQAGDTVTFSRLDPEGKLVMGYRRAPNSLNAQETQPSTICSSLAAPPISVGTIDNITPISNLTGFLSQSVKGATDSQGNARLGQYSQSDSGYGWHGAEKAGFNIKDAPFYHSLPSTEKRKVRKITSKSKRVKMDLSEAAEFRITWDEAQDLLRSPPNVTPSIVTIDGYDFEEFEEPPVFGKRTIFTARNSGSGEDQWAQCDECGSWRRVPADVFLPTRWTCADNVWDTERNSCKVPQEVDHEEIESLLQPIKEVKKQEVVEPLKEVEPLCGLEALANAATAGETNTPTSPAATTKHPRHRPGCTCIVCIQPPSGKGPKHKPTCNCNVCMTVKRRFKTLMMRRKNRQSEREAENASRKKKPWMKEDGEMNNKVKWQNDSHIFENVSQQGNVVVAFPGVLPWLSNFSSNGDSRLASAAAYTGAYTYTDNILGDDLSANGIRIDLNSKPEREEEMNRGARVSMMRLLRNASYPLDRYLKEQGLSSIFCSQQITIPATTFASIVADRKSDEHKDNGSSATVFSPE